MKNQYIFKLATALLLSLSSVIAYAQTEVAIAKNYFNQNTAKEKISTADIARMEVSSAYLSPTTGWYHIYFKQMYESIEVYNGILNTTIKDGNVAYVSNSFVPNLENSIQQNSLITKQLSLGKTQISPVQALQIAATNVNLKTSLISEITTQKSTSLVTGLVSKATLQDKGLSDEMISVQIYWFPYMDVSGEKPEQKIALTYNVQFLTKDGKNKWSTHVDAFSGKVLANHDEVIHCDFGKPDHDCASHTEKPFKIFPKPQTNATATVAGNTYNVFDYPLEAPTFGSRTLVSSPYNRFAPAGTGPSATNGWHDDGTTSFTNTKGNNVDAKDDIANDNETTIGSSPSSATLYFDFPYSQTTGSAATNLNAAITNLFYWNNVMHDVLWQYGFDEPSGNFQKDNQGRGGAGNDFVYADAQDGSGTNNATFQAPVDGGNGRMQMFIFSDAGSPAYTPDSDFDNGIIAHEYGHGWSIRLTGGPANSNCLSNAEQGGEGWSDYIALMTTTNWASLSPNLASANIPRGIGTYSFGQATTDTGFRTFHYSYDKATYNNNITYAAVGNSGPVILPHLIGSIWATMLWDMTWEIILQDNFIAPNIYNVPTSTSDPNYKGNIAALKLVNEGLRLQPCSPSFVQARDAILQADLMLFGGRYRCAIGKAFARRGLGLYASTGASSNDLIVTEDFTPITGPGLSSPTSASVCSNTPFTYTGTTTTAGTFTFAWTRAAVSGISNPAGSASSASINETLINTTNAPVTVTYLFTISPDACGGTPAPQPVNVVVNPSTITPTVATYAVCQNGSVPSGGGLAVAASTLVTTVNGTIAIGPTYVRGRGNNVTTYTADRTVFYTTYTFVAPSSGPVTFTTTDAALSPGVADDTYLTLYQTSFNPATPATNFLRGDDDSGPGFLSSLTHTLTAGTTYIVVVSTYTTGATGTFTLQASTAVFGQTVNWYLNASGGSPLATGAVFNPVGVAGSGIPNTATAGSTTFYVADALYPDCRTATTFSITFSIIGPPTPAISGTTTICNGQSTTLTATGGNYYVWSNGSTNAAITINPSTNTSYTATVYQNCVTSTNLITNVVNFNAGNFSLINSTNSYGAASSLFDNIDNTGGGTFHATRTINGLDWGISYNLGGDYLITNLSIDRRNDCCTDRGEGGVVQVWRNGTMVYQSDILNSTGDDVLAATPAPNVVGTEVRYVFLAGVNTLSGESTLNISEWIIGGTKLCSATATANVVVNAIPTATASSNSPICAGTTLNLTGGGGTGYAWSGPSFTSAQQNPSISGATTSASGIYTLTVTNTTSGCTSTVTTSVTVNPNPTATASSNSPICAGTTLNLTGGGGTGYAWAGPSFTSVQQNPSISGATTAASGIYTLTVTNGYGCSTSTSTIVNVGSNATLVTLTSPADDYSTGTILKTASSVNGKITATNKVTGSAKVDYKAKSIQLNAGFKADNGTVFNAVVGGCN